MGGSKRSTFLGPNSEQSSFLHPSGSACHPALFECVAALLGLSVFVCFLIFILSLPFDDREKRSFSGHAMQVLVGKIESIIERSEDV